MPKLIEADFLKECLAAMIWDTTVLKDVLRIVDEQPSKTAITADWIVNYICKGHNSRETTIADMVMDFYAEENERAKTD